MIILNAKKIQTNLTNTTCRLFVNKLYILWIVILSKGEPAFLSALGSSFFHIQDHVLGSA